MANVTTLTSSMLVMNNVLTDRMSKNPVGSSRRTLKVTAPLGPSSGGGELARQSLVLSTRTEEPVCGWVDFIGLTAELRDWETTKLAYEGRYRLDFDVTEPEYRAFLSNVLGILGELGVRAQVVGNSENYAPTDPSMGNTAPARMVLSGSQRSSPLPVLLGVLLALIGLGVAMLVLFR
ncbi:MAG: hypothetical protein ACO1OB_17465 [Archangium sp.]